MSSTDYLSPSPNPIKPNTGANTRSSERIKAHYNIERELADQLRNAPKSERRHLYTTLYEELYKRVPDHPQLTRKASKKDRESATHKQMAILKRLLDKNKSYLEVGPGDCSVTFAAAKIAKQAYAVDVSTTITQSTITPGNFELLISDGCSIPVPANSIDTVYSNQLMEHLHPDDALEQLQNIYKALKPGGHYLCVTPNRLNGPHDVSKMFDRIATGFHLKEYSATELYKLFKEAGFSKVEIYIGGNGHYIKFPIGPTMLCEFLLERLPLKMQSKLAQFKPIMALINVRLLGTKRP